MLITAVPLSCAQSIPGLRSATEGSHRVIFPKIPSASSLQSSDRETPKIGIVDSDRFSVRSDSGPQINSKRESMIGSLKKLFHQQHQGSAMIPPDQNICEF